MQSIYARKGSEFTVNTQRVGDQWAPSVAGFAGGGFVSVWMTGDAAADGSGRAIKMQRYDAAGVATGGEALVNGLAAGDQRYPSVTTLRSGQFVVTWETTDTSGDGAGTAIKAQLFSDAGLPLGGEFRVNAQALADQTRPVVTAMADGGFLVAWETSDAAQDGHSSAIKAQRYDAAGTVVGAEFLVNPRAVGYETAQHITGLANGGFMATWTAGSGAGADIYAQMFDASGAKTGAAFRVNTLVPNSQGAPQATQLADGRIVITWGSYASSNNYDQDIKAQIFSATGVRVGGEFLVSTSKRTDDGVMPMIADRPQVQDLADGGFVISWTLSGGSAPASSIRAQFFDATGQRVGGEQLVSTATDRLEAESALAIDGNGGLLAVWANANAQARDYDIRGQFFTTEVGPVIQSNGGGDVAAVNAAENQTAVTTVRATGEGVTYAIVGGADAAGFTIDAATGALAFIKAPNFESKGDIGRDGVWDVVVSATKGSLQDVQALAIRITNVDEPLVLASGYSSFLHVENDTRVVETFRASDPDNGVIGWSLQGTDAARFRITAAGELFFVAAPDYEAEADRMFDVTVVAGDGAFTASRAVTVELLNSNEGPVITSDGGGDAATLTLAENVQNVTRVTVADPDGRLDSYTYALSGADAALFGINQATGHLYFRNSRDFETPTDADRDGVYEVTVSAGDAWNPADTQRLSIRIADANDAVVISSPFSFTVQEGSTAVGFVKSTDQDGDAVRYAIMGGADAARFAIDATTGELSFAVAPDAEAPTDATRDNQYQVTVGASDGASTTTQTVTVGVRDVNEAPVLQASGAEVGADLAVEVPEGDLEVARFAAVDPEGKAIFYALSGDDAALFGFDAASGQLRFVDAPDHETSRGANYRLSLTASDGVLGDTVAVQVTIGDVNEGVAITSAADFDVVEGATAVGLVATVDADGDAVRYAIAGGEDAARFDIDAVTGALSFATAPDAEAPGDVDGDGRYRVTVSASDGVLSTTQDVSVAVADVNEAPVLLANGAAPGSELPVEVAEGVAEVARFAVADPEGQAIAWTLSGEDAGLFGFDAVTGALSFVDAPDYETRRADAYRVALTASDGALSDTVAVQVTVGDVNEGVAFVGAQGAYKVAEGRTAVATFAAKDQDGDAVRYTLAGADAAAFGIDAETGALFFAAAPDFEAPGAADGGNAYRLTVIASDGSLSAAHDFTVDVANVNEGLAFTSFGGGAGAFTVAENGTAVGKLTARDADGDASSFAIAGGADAARFQIDAATGELRFVAAPNYEAPVDADRNGVYEVTVGATDGEFVAYQKLSVTVGDVREGVTVVGTSAGEVLSDTRSATNQPRATAMEDTLYGLGGNDTLDAAGGNDRMDGGSGNDVLYFGVGADELVGGAGLDRFVMRALSDSRTTAPDVIYDFVRGQDRIDLSMLDARTTVSGDQAFSFIGAAGFGRVAGQLRFERVGGELSVMGDVNGDGIADFAIRLHNLTTLTAGDFML